MNGLTYEKSYKLYPELALSINEREALEKLVAISISENRLLVGHSECIKWHLN